MEAAKNTTAEKKPLRQIKTSSTPAKVVKKPEGKPAAVVTAKQAAAPKVNAHVAAGIVGTYSGSSDLFTNGRKVAIKQISGLTTNDMTDRRRSALYDLRAGYGGKSFAVKGWDNGSLRDLAAMGLIELTGGTVQGEYLMDGATPVTAKLTKAGMDYGRA